LHKTVPLPGMTYETKVFHIHSCVSLQLFLLGSCLCLDSASGKAGNGISPHPISSSRLPSDEGPPNSVRVIGLASLTSSHPPSRSFLINPSFLHSLPLLFLPSFLLFFLCIQYPARYLPYKHWINIGSIISISLISPNKRKMSQKELSSKPNYSSAIYEVFFS